MTSSSIASATCDAFEMVWAVMDDVGHNEGVTLHVKFRRREVEEFGMLQL